MQTAAYQAAPCHRSYSILLLTMPVSESDMEKIVEDIAPDLIRQSDALKVEGDDLHKVYQGQGFFGKSNEDALVMDKLAKDCAKQVGVLDKASICLIEKALTQEYVLNPLENSLSLKQEKLRLLEKRNDPARQEQIAQLKAEIEDLQQTKGLIQTRFDALDQSIRSLSEQQGNKAQAANQRWAEEPEAAGEIHIREEGKEVRFDSLAKELDGGAMAQQKMRSTEIAVANQLIQELQNGNAVDLNDVRRSLRNGAIKLSDSELKKSLASFQPALDASQELTKQIEALEKPTGWVRDQRSQAKVDAQIGDLKQQRQQIFENLRDNKPGICNRKPKREMKGRVDERGGDVAGSP